MKPIELPFYFNASPEILKRAEALRNQMTEAEKVLWDRLRKNKVNGYRFRTQHPISKFIVDFYCHKALLIIEIDGAIHKNEIVAERDEGREEELKRLGLIVLRFTNDEVLKNTDAVCIGIARALENSCNNR